MAQMWDTWLRKPAWPGNGEAVTNPRREGSSPEDGTQCVCVWGGPRTSLSWLICGAWNRCREVGEGS